MKVGTQRRTKTPEWDWKSDPGGEAVGTGRPGAPEREDGLREGVEPGTG